MITITGYAWFHGFLRIGFDSAGKTFFPWEIADWGSGFGCLGLRFRFELGWQRL
jgi:hypothetical protein